MIKANQLKTLLKINGITEEASDDAIAAVLKGARYSDAEAAEIISLYRQNIIPNETRTDGLHKVFFSDVHLQPQEVSRLLGIDVQITERVNHYSHNTQPSAFQFILIWFVSVVVALSGILFYMFINEIGLFHHTTTMPWQGREL